MGDELEEFKRNFAKKIFEIDPFGKFESEGIITCPNCKQSYKPEYERKEDAPEGTIYREQFISGICSDKCWDEYFLG